MNNYRIIWDSAWDPEEDRDESYISNESAEGALEFFLADNNIAPRQGDLALIYTHGSDEKVYVHAEVDEDTGHVTWTDKTDLSSL